MKWKLTLGAMSVLLVVGVVLFIVIQVSNERTDKVLFAALKARSIANASTLSAEIGYEMALNLDNEIRKKLEHTMSDHKESYSILVLKGNKKPYVTVGQKVATKALLSRFPRVDKNQAIIADKLVVALSPIKAEEQVSTLGYVIYIESMTEYYALRKEMTIYSLVAFFFGLIVIMVGAYAIGHRFSEPIRKLISAAEAISAGDLENIDVVPKSSGSSETDRLATAIQSMAAALQKQVTAVKTLINDMFEMSKEVASIVAQLASSASQQASAVTETATTVEEMERTGKSAAGNANSIVDAAERTTEASIRGREAVKTANDIIAKIRADSQEMSGKSANMLAAVEEIELIINTVKGIADQSKILAVNASIEAAKAGEFGAGFAVVAQEVKDLAEQSKEATQQITGTLTSIRRAIDNVVETAKGGKQRTEEGVSMIANAGAIMNDLSEAIKDNSEFANVIASSIKQHSVGLSQIATAMEQINTTAVENKSVSRRIEDSVRQITTSIDELQGLVGRWRTPSREGVGS